MQRRRRSILRALLAVVAAAGGALAGPAPAHAAYRVPGNDYSWPQCPVGVGDGQGQPLPTGSHRFAIVGLTNGSGLHENPCLASQWRFARQHAAYVTGYIIVTYPTRTQRLAARTGHYGRCSTYECRLRNNGWAQADFTDASLRRIGAHPATVWIDIEPRSKQPWTSHRSWNSQVIRATIAGLQAHGYAVGIYSNRRMWNLIAGFRMSLREWVPADSLSYGCRLSFGGPVWLSQDMHAYSPTRAYDENGTCRRAPALGRWFQRAHPTVTTSVNPATGIALARFDGGRAMSLQTTATQPPSIAVAATTAGDVPLFATVGADGSVRVRALSSWWAPVADALCTDGPSLAVDGRTLYVGCTAADGSQSMTTVALDAYGRPTPSAPAAQAGPSDTAPPPAPVRATSVTLS